MEALEASAAAQSLRRSVWLYPAANVLHVLGLMGFFAAVAAMDVAALRARRAAALRAFIAPLRPLAAVLLAAQVATGIMLFLPEASHIWENAIFRLKLIAIFLALANVAVLEVVLRPVPPDARPPAGVRGVAALSLAIWLTAAALGRLIAYF
jgi:hypothetical protein